MKVCLPVAKDMGLESKVYKHFGSAPVFIIVETGKGIIMGINNNDQHHAYGACNPLKALHNQKVDIVVVGGIGAGALNKLHKLGIKVFHAQESTVKENLALLKSQALSEFELKDCCTGHHGFKSSCKHY